MTEEGRTEEWHETCARVCRGLIELEGKFTQDELEYLYDTMFNLRGTVSGRALWQLGTQTVRDVGGDSLQNCWHVVTNDLSAFTFTFNQLMLGGGVGFNILPQHVYELPRLEFNPHVERTDSNDCDFIVPDNREGWVELLDRIFQSFFLTGRPLRYNTKAIRPAGAPIKGFGGTASGSEPLVKGMKEIVRILRHRYTQKLRPIDAMDIMNIIGKVVVAGNVRRSSEIAIGDPTDLSFLSAKDWTRHTVPEWRTMSNNSVAADSIDELQPQFWQAGYESEGEPYGLINLKNCRRFGRIADGVDHRPDYTVEGVNPCAEITLSNKEPCNLAETFLPNIKDVDEWKKVAKVLYKAAKTISCAPFSDPVTDEVVKQNHRLGIGVTGYMQANSFRNPQGLGEVYQHLEQLDHAYSREIGVNESVKLTTVKPSGTLSLLPGVTPGMHAAVARWMFRTVRMSASHPLVDVCREHGYHVEPRLNLDGSNDHSTMVVYFPVETPKAAVLAEDMDVIQELEVQKELQTHWADNSVSATHYFNRDDVPRIREWLGENYESGVKTTSFLLHHGHGFVQAPYIPISQEKYHEEAAKIRPITRALIRDEDEDYDELLECDGGSCPTK
jgi:ribonucleotide reductase alpha subunit